MQLQDFDKHLKTLSEEFQNSIRRDLPKVVGNLAVSLFKRNFQQEAFFGRRWQEVQRRLKPEKGAAGRRKILSGATGNLGRSIQAFPHDGSVSVESDLPYSAAHNDGTSTAGRGRHTTIPQRQFVGHHPDLDREIAKKITQTLNKILKK